MFYNQISYDIIRSISIHMTYTNWWRRKANNPKERYRYLHLAPAENEPFIIIMFMEVGKFITYQIKYRT